MSLSANLPFMINGKAATPPAFSTTLSRIVRGTQGIASIQRGRQPRTTTLSPEGGAIMARKYIDCRDHPSEVKCTVALSADSEEELMDAVIQHAKTVHKYQITPEFQDMIRKGMKAGNPPA